VGFSLHGTGETVKNFWEKLGGQINMVMSCWTPTTGHLIKERK